MDPTLMQLIQALVHRDFEVKALRRLVHQCPQCAPHAPQPAQITDAITAAATVAEAEAILRRATGSS